MAFQFQSIKLSGKAELGNPMSREHLGLQALTANPSRCTVSVPAAPLVAPLILALFVPPTLWRQVKLQDLLSLADSPGKGGLPGS